MEHKHACSRSSNKSHTRLPLDLYVARHSALVRVVAAALVLQGLVEKLVALRVVKAARLPQVVA